MEKPLCPECNQPEGSCYLICPTQDPYQGDQRAEHDDYYYDSPPYDVEPFDNEE